jgi:hypothetical protein
MAERATGAGLSTTVELSSGRGAIADAELVPDFGAACASKLLTGSSAATGSGLSAIVELSGCGAVGANGDVVSVFGAECSKLVTRS